MSFLANSMLSTYREEQNPFLYLLNIYAVVFLYYGYTNKSDGFMKSEIPLLRRQLETINGSLETINLVFLTFKCKTLGMISANSPLRKVVLTFIWNNSKFGCTIKVKIRRIEANLITGANTFVINLLLLSVAFGHKSSLICVD